MTNVMPRDRHVGAVFRDRSSAVEAVDELLREGLVDDHLEAAVCEPDARIVFEEDTDRDVISGVGHGIVIGVPIGALLGMTMLTLLASVAGLATGGSLLLAGGAVGALAGAYFGGFLGLAINIGTLEEELDWERVSTGPGEVVVIAGGHGSTVDVNATMARHGGRRIDKPVHVG